MSNNWFEDEFTVHVVSSASMEIFDSNTFASFRKLFNDKIQFSGDWRVALCEIIFSIKIENIVNGNLTVYNLEDHEDSQKMSSGANIISRPYSAQKLAFMPGKFDTVAQFLVTVKRTIGFPQFSFRKIKSSEKYETLLGKKKGITFPSEEIPSIIGINDIPDSNGIHIGYKMNPNANKFMKSDETKAYYGEFIAGLCAGKHLIFIYTNEIEYQLFYVSLTQNDVSKTVVYVSLHQLIACLTDLSKLKSCVEQHF